MRLAFSLFKASRKSMLQTAILQVTCAETGPVCIPSPQLAPNPPPPIQLRIGKVETTSLRELRSLIDQLCDWSESASVIDRLSGLKYTKLQVVTDGVLAMGGNIQ